MQIITCWIEHPVRSLDRPFTYLSDQRVQPGCRVIVPFGLNNLTGFVESAENTEESEAEIEKRLSMKLRKVIRVIDEEPLITPELHDLALWMRDDTLSTAISCFQAMLPAKIKPRSGNQKIITERWVALADQEVSLTPRQLEAWTMVQKAGEVRYSTLRKAYPSIAPIL